MFYTSNERKRLEGLIKMQDEKIDILKLRVDALSKTLVELSTRNNPVTVTLQDAPHGLRKDGVPKKKTGPKGPRKVKAA